VDDFKSLFTEEPTFFPSHLENLITLAITDLENSKLYSFTTPELIKHTLFQMQELKSPGPNGFPMLFCKKY